MSQLKYDICIIGSGVAGAITAFSLASKGMRVVILEAGPSHDIADRQQYLRDLFEKKIDPWHSNIPERDVYTVEGENSYYKLSRVKAVGGTTLHWGGLATRYHETDFEMKNKFGLADDWPISYEELEPYYGRAESMMGVSGSPDNPFASFRSTDFPMPSFPNAYGDQFFIKACNKLGIKTHSVPWARNINPYQNRPACAAFATCGRFGICPIMAQYSAETHVNMAKQSENFTLITDACVVRLNTDSKKNVLSATYMTKNKTEHEIKAKVFVLAAHAIESARLLLLSESSQYPNGLANNSGLVGKNYMDHPGIIWTGRVKDKIWPYRIGFSTLSSHQFTTPHNRDEAGGFKLEFDNNVGPYPSEIAKKSMKWGDTLAAEVRESFGHHLSVYTHVEQLPAQSNSVSLDHSKLDYFGNPAPKITLSLGEYEKQAIKNAAVVLSNVLDALGATEIDTGEMEKPGFGAHHMGTCKMGNDPENSVVDRNLKAHDVNNLYIIGSSVFPTGGVLHPTLTISALAIRAAEYIYKSHQATL